MYYLKPRVTLLFLSLLISVAELSSYQRVDYRIVVEEKEIMTNGPEQVKPLPEVAFALPDAEESLALAEEKSEWILKATHTVHAARAFFPDGDPGKIFRLQNLLSQLGGKVGPVDGIVGPNTQKGLLQVKTRLLQTLLQELGESPGALDGVYGPQTERALELCRKKLGLEKNRAWDFETIRLLLARLLELRKSTNRTGIAAQ